MSGSETVASPPQPAAAPADGGRPWEAIAGGLSGLVVFAAASLGLFRRVGGRRGAEPA